MFSFSTHSNTFVSYLYHGMMKKTQKKFHTYFIDSDVHFFPCIQRVKRVLVSFNRLFFFSRRSLSLLAVLLSLGSLTKVIFCVCSILLLLFLSVVFFLLHRHKWKSHIHIHRHHQRNETEKWRYCLYVVLYMCALVLCVRVCINDYDKRYGLRLLFCKFMRVTDTANCKVTFWLLFPLAERLNGLFCCLCLLYFLFIYSFIEFNSFLCVFSPWL